MTYRTASQRPIRRASATARALFAQHGVPASRQVHWLSLGVPAAVAVRIEATGAEADWLASTFSVKGLRRLTTAHEITHYQVVVLRRLSELNLSRLRGYLSGTELGLSQIKILMEAEVPSRETIRWTQRHREAGVEVGGTTLAVPVLVATVVHGLPPDQIGGWVRFTNRVGILRDPRQGSSQFLGGDTALFAAAGISPAEAEQMVRSGSVDRPALRTLAALATSPQSTPLLSGMCDR